MTIRLLTPAVLAALLLPVAPATAAPVAQAVPGRAGQWAAELAATTATAARAAASGTVGVAARYRFDGGLSAVVTDDSGNGHTLRMIAGNGGAARAVPRGHGQAVRFPAKCADKPRRCPHAALQSPGGAGLNPGSRDFAFGASVLLPHHQTSKGQNIVQKGYSATSSQWKLQVDGRRGRPSCVLVGTRPGIKIVRSSVTVADGRWHTVECRRRGTWLAVLVDGAVRGNRPVATSLSVSNDKPLSLGGKGAFADNDQFHGTMDDVWVRIG